MVIPMHVQDKFNKRSATLVECQLPVVRLNTRPAGDLAVPREVHIEFFPKPENPDHLVQRSLSAYLTAAEALDLAEHLIATARRLVK